MQYCQACDSIANAMGNERASRYHEFMKGAVSHKTGQAIHRILKKMPASMERPVSKSKMDTTEDQHHADEQIHQWADVWGAKVDNGEYVNSDA